MRSEDDSEQSGDAAAAAVVVVEVAEVAIEPLRIRRVMSGYKRRNTNTMQRTGRDLGAEIMMNKCLTMLIEMR